MQRGPGSPEPGHFPLCHRSDKSHVFTPQRLPDAAPACTPCAPRPPAKLRGCQIQSKRCLLPASFSDCQAPTSTNGSMLPLPGHQLRPSAVIYLHGGPPHVGGGPVSSTSLGSAQSWKATFYTRRVERPGTGRQAGEASLRALTGVLRDPRRHLLSGGAKNCRQVSDLVSQHTPSSRCRSPGAKSSPRLPVLTQPHPRPVPALPTSSS